MSYGHSVISEPNVVIADEESRVVRRIAFDYSASGVAMSVLLREGRNDGLVYLSPSETMKLSKELRRLAIAAFEAV